MALQNVEANITLDLYNHDTTPATVKAIQLDSQTRYVAAMLQSMGAEYGLDSGATVQLIVIRPDKVGVQITGTTFTYGDEGAQFLGPYAELTQAALAVSGKMRGQFKITSGTQILRTEIFAISNGEALDASTDEWADEYDGYNLEEMATSIETNTADIATLEADVSQIKEDISDMNTATSADVGKALKVKTVTNGKVTEWEFGSAGGGGGGQDGFSPIVAVTDITGGHRVSVTDANGTKTFDVMNGTNGVSPTITVTNITGGHRVSITDVTGTKTFDVMDGSGSGGSSVSVDDTLTVSGAAADAKEAGDRISDLDSRVTDIEQGGTSSIGEFLGNTPLTLTEDANIKLVATQTTEYDLGSGTVADFSKRKNVTLRNVTMSVNSNNVELNIASSVTNFYDAYAQMNFDGFEVGEEYTITIEPLGNQTDLVAGGTFYFLDSGGTALASPIICMDETMTQTFTATTTSIILQIYPANSTYWDDNYRTARFRSMVITGRLNGSFNGTFSAGIVASGTTISSTPSCKVYAVEDDASVYKSRHAGKVCVCFGDSVTGFMAPPNDYPSVLAQLTGMTVYNVGFGGCRMSDTHPYAAYKRFGMCALVDAIVSGDWTEQDQYVDQIESETFPQAHLTTLKGIDWDSVDFVTIFYGGNDAGNDVAIGTAGSSDKQTMVGALKYAVDKLLTAYPHLKILVLTQIFRYWLSDSKDSDEMVFTMGGQSYHYYDWGDEEIKAAQLLKVPVVDMYRTLGINSITRTLYLRASDQTHPSAEGNRLIAGKIAGKLLSEY